MITGHLPGKYAFDHVKATVFKTYLARELLPAVIIAFDAKRYFNNSTGLGFYSRTLVDSLRKLYPEHQYLLYTPYNRGNLNASDDGIRLPDTWLGRKFHAIWRSRGMVGQLRRDKVNIFHGLSHELPMGLRRHGISSVVSMHDLIFMRYPDMYPAIDRFFYEKKYRRSANEADIVVAISQQTRDDLQTFFGLKSDRVRVIGQSCDAVYERLSLRWLPDRMALPLPPGVQIPERDFLISVGSLTPRKNWHTLIDALFLLKQRGSEMPLVAVGSGGGAYARGLKIQAERLGVRVYWLGYLPVEALALLYRRASALIYPSVFEGFGIPILEAMVMGIPVVTSEGGCFQEIGGDAVLYADPWNAESLAEQMLKSQDTAVQARLLAGMPGQAALFSPERISAAWMEVYHLCR